MSTNHRLAGLLWLLVAGLTALWLLPVSVAWKLAPDLGHAWAVPVLMAYLWWDRWAERPQINQRRLAWAWWTLALVASAVHLPLRLLLTPFPLWPALLCVHTLLFAALALIAGWLFAGRTGVRWVGGPLILALAALPVPSLIETTIILPLRTGMATAAAEISNFVGHPAIAMGTSLRLGNSWVGVDAACGGIRSLQACLMIGLFFGEWYRFGWLRRGALVAAGIAAALLGNFGRVLFLSLRANAGAQAVEDAHDFAGWLAMGFSLLLTGWLACRWAGYRWPEQRKAPAPVERVVPNALAASIPPPAASTFSASWLWLSAVVVLFALNETATRYWYQHGEIARTTIPQWTAVLPEHDPTFQHQPLGEAAREMLRPDFFVAGRWRAAPALYASSYYVEWRLGQVARSMPFNHNPAVCLPYSGCELLQSLDPITVNWSGGDIPFYTYKFRRMGADILVAFAIWDPSRGRPLGQPRDLDSWKAWWDYRWTEVAEARQNQPAQLLAVMVPWSDNATHQAHAVLNNLVQPLRQ